MEARKSFWRIARRRPGVVLWWLWYELYDRWQRFWGREL